MNHKIIFLSEMGFTGKIPRTHTNCRTEFAQMIALDAVHWPMLEMNSVHEQFDIAILLIGKGEPFREQIYNIDIVNAARKFARKVLFMQEGPAWIFQNMPLHHQFWHYNVLAEVDGILTENYTDIKYYKGLVDKPITDIPSLMIEDLIKPALEIKKQDKCIIGGTMNHWYAGFDSYVIAHKFKVPMFAPSMGRKKPAEDGIPNLTYLPYMVWKDWIYKLAEFKYAIHLMPTIAAGTFALNCAFLGIPCIGYREADTQYECHPDLSIDLYDLESAKNLAVRLQSDIDFYSHCSMKCYELYKEKYNEDFFQWKMTNFFNSIL